MNRSAPASRAASSTDAGPAPGRPRVRFAATVPATRAGCCAAQATRSRHQSRSASPRGRPPATTRPSSGRVSPSSTRPRVVLPAPLGPATATSSPGRRSRSTRSSAAPGRPGYRTVTPRSPTPTPAGGAAGPGAGVGSGGSRSRASRMRSVPARPSALAWNRLATVRRGAYSSGTSSRTVRAGRRPTVPATRRTPSVTATRAVDRVAARSRTAPDRNDSRSVPMVVRR